MHMHLCDIRLQNCHIGLNVKATRPRATIFLNDLIINMLNSELCNIDEKKNQIQFISKFVQSCSIWYHAIVFCMEKAICRVMEVYIFF